MAITFSAAGTGVATEASGGDLNPTCPATITAGDILIAHVMYEGTTTAPSTPSGWTLLSGPHSIESTGRHWIFGKIADGTEDGAAISFGTPAVTTMRTGRIYRFLGRVSGTITELVTQFAHLSHATDPQMPDVTTQMAGALAVACVGQFDDNATASATGESGGDWVEAVAEYVQAATTPDSGLSLQTCTPTADPGTVTGGSIATVNDPCGVIAFQIQASALSAISGSTTASLAPTGTLTGTGSLAGSVTASLAPTGTLDGAGALAGSVTASLASTATLAGDGALVGTMTVSLAPTGTIEDTGGPSLIDGVVNLSLAPTGTLTGAGALAGSVTASLTPAGTLAGAGALTGSAAFSLAPTGTTEGAGALSGIVNLLLDPAGTMRGDGVLAGSLTATLAPAGDLLGLVFAEGAVTASLTPSATLAGTGALAGTCTCSLAPAGALVGAGAMGGTATCTLTPTATTSGDATQNYWHCAMMFLIGRARRGPRY